MEVVGSVISFDKKRPAIRTFLSEQLTLIAVTMRASSVSQDVCLRQKLPPNFYAMLCELAGQGVFSELDIEKRPEPSTPSVIWLATQSVGTGPEAVARVVGMVAAAERFADRQGWASVQPGLSNDTAISRWTALCRQLCT